MSKDKRQYGRVFVNTQIQIAGVDHSGLQFVEKGRLVDVGGMGCRFLAQQKFRLGDIVGIEPLGPLGEKLADEFPRMFVIVWSRDKGMFVEAGARCLEENELMDTAIYRELCNPNVIAK